MKWIFTIILLSYFGFLQAQTDRWHFAEDGGIRWSVTQGEKHADHIEMSGKHISAIVYYGVDSTGHLLLKRKLVFPMLRTIPNDTHASLVQMFGENISDSIMIDGKYFVETPAYFYLNGYLQSGSRAYEGLTLTRQSFPSTDKAAYLETYTLVNSGNNKLCIRIPEWDKNIETDAARGVYGSYVLNSHVYNGGAIDLLPGASHRFSVAITGRKKTQDAQYFSATYEFEKRTALVKNWQQSLVLETPNDTINRMFAFAKIRAAESIFDTKQGLMHAPGGGAYYAAIWANDQAEYVNPFFPFLGYSEGNESARNSFRHFARFLNNGFIPIPSSIIAEGTDVWNGAGDRGDQAMIGYGASLFALYSGKKEEAIRLWPLISWCNAYLRHKTTKQGVIVSDSDELEGRFEAGKINLSTNVLAYGSFVYAARIAEGMGLKDEAAVLNHDARLLKKAIEKYFGASVEGYKTYRYYEGNTVLRSWICIPLVMGIMDRKQETIRALLSPRLWTRDGILTEAGSKTFWDRSTLYAFRGIFKAGETDTALNYFKYYSAKRLLGDHVPYAIEAWPEGDQRHLSAESGLYCRTVTEGLFGFNPVSFNSFTINPKLPKEWNEMSLKNIKAFDKNFDIKVSRDGAQFRIDILVDGKLSQQLPWNGQAEINITLP